MRPPQASSTVDGLIMEMARDAEARNPYSAGRGSRVASYATALGVALQLPDSDLVALHRGGFLHDIGTIAIGQELLRKPGGLTAAEFEVVKRHTVIGDVLCAGLEDLRALRPIIRWHHERADGSGYPDGLVESQTPLVAQVVSLADAYDALTTTRSYRAAWPSEVACETLLIEARQGWRPLPLVREFVSLAHSRRLAHLRNPDIPPVLGH